MRNNCNSTNFEPPLPPHGRGFYETQFASEEPKLESKLVLKLSETKSLGVSIEQKLITLDEKQLK